jgi:hypothetical protein
MTPSLSTTRGLDETRLVVMVVFGMLMLLATSLLMWVAVWASRKWSRRFLELLKPKRLEDTTGENEKVEISQDFAGEATSVFTTRWNFDASATTLVHRHHRQFDVYAAAARGSLDEILVNLDMVYKVDMNQVHEEYGTVLAAAARSGSLEILNYILLRKPDLHVEGGRYPKRPAGCRPFWEQAGG